MLIGSFQRSKCMETVDGSWWLFFEMTSGIFPVCARLKSCRWEILQRYSHVDQNHSHTERFFCESSDLEAYQQRSIEISSKFSTDEGSSFGDFFFGSKSGPEAGGSGRHPAVLWWGGLARREYMGCWRLIWQSHRKKNGKNVLLLPRFSLSLSLSLSKLMLISQASNIVAEDLERFRDIFVLMKNIRKFHENIEHVKRYTTGLLTFKQTERNSSKLTTPSRSWSICRNILSTCSCTPLSPNWKIQWRQYAGPAICNFALIRFESSYRCCEQRRGFILSPANMKINDKSSI